MKALILNSGTGSRMGVLTSEHPKCMTEISTHETILSRQLKMITGAGIEEAVITTGYYDGVLVNYCQSLDLPIHYTFVKTLSTIRLIISIRSIAPESIWTMILSLCMVILCLKMRFLTGF